MTIDLDAITNNIKLYESVTNKTVFGVVKANAYGHGDIMIARHLESLGIRVLCVSSLDEALHLYKHGITADILIFGPTDPQAIALYHKPQFIYTLTSMEYFKRLSDDMQQVRFHIEVNTGMNRLGFKEVEEIKEVLDTTPHIIEGIYTHFSSADEVSDFTDTQAKRFESILNTLDYPFKWIHAGNSHGSISYQNPSVNAQRIGIGMYGYVEPNMFEAFSLKLKLAMKLETMIVHIDSLRKGEPVGYNRTFHADQDMLFGTLPIGYADGLNPLNQRLPFKVGKRNMPILGKICMDQTMIQVNSSDSVGDWVEIVGPNRSLYEIAQHTDTIPYVVMAQLNDRITRKYVSHGEVIATINIQNN
ncbi:alanine racemase [Erysipelothrix larvae]|nr:alanine racemase [Erysipelothrix larvae]